MKKIVIVLILIILCGCADIKEPSSASDSKPVIENEDVILKYVDENPVEISLYIDNVQGGLDLVENEYHTSWQLKKDIVVFGSVFSKEDIIAPDHFQNIWKNYASKYEGYEKYKTAWQVSFSLNDGTSINQMIFHPDDVAYFYDYLELYLYDSVNPEIGVWYSHLTASDMTQNTVMTSLKLTAGSKYSEINGPILVSVFTYDGLDDFDEKGMYRGRSVSSVKVYND